MQRSEQKQPPASPSLLKDPGAVGGFKTDLTVLIWQAQEDGLEYAARNTPRFPLSVNIPTDISASLATVESSWNPAFKLLLGYHFASPSWDLNGRWTWFYSHSRSSESADLSSAGAGLLPLWIPPQAAIATFPVYGNAKANLLLHVNNIDIELAYAGGVTRSFFLKLHGGLKAISIFQIYRADYSGGFFDGTNRMLDSHAQARTKCLGVGPRFGFGSKWNVARGWSLIAEAAGAFALSDVRTKREDHSIGTNSGVPQEVDINFREGFWVWRPLVEGKAGAQWEYCFGAKNNRVLNLELAYEIQEYWDQNMLSRYADSALFYSPFPSRGNLTLQGFSLTLALGY